MPLGPGSTATDAVTAVATVAKYSRCTIFRATSLNTPLDISCKPQNIISAGRYCDRLKRCSRTAVGRGIFLPQDSGTRVKEPTDFYGM